MVAPSRPHDPRRTDEKSVRDELTRVFDVCGGCRRCVELCGSFPTLFGLLDEFDEPDAGRLTPAQQDRIVDACFHCGQCVVDCPYSPERRAAGVDVPRSMLRAEAMRRTAGQHSIRRRQGARLLGRVDLIGRAATGSAVVRGMIGAAPGTVRRRVLAALTGLSPARALPPFAHQRFSVWFAKHGCARPVERPRGRVAVFPTCVVEYQATGIGKALVAVLARNGVECSVAAAGCCGAPSLHEGDIDRFSQIATGNVDGLAAIARAGDEIIVLQPTCQDVLRQEYGRHVGGPDAALVGDHIVDAAEYLVRLHERDGAAFDTDFGGHVPERIAYHAPRTSRVDGGQLPGRELLELTGAEVSVVAGPGVGGVWSLRADNERDVSCAVDRLAELVDLVGADELAGDCALDSAAIADRTGRPVSHPIEVIARAYGIADA